MKGIIALDIDGTIAFDREEVPLPVAEKLKALETEGWAVVLITGRTFRWSVQSIQKLSFPFHLIVQNGATVLEMPAQRVVDKKYLSKKIFPAMDRFCSGRPSDYVVYGSMEVEERCYYRPDRFCSSIREYLERREASLGEELVAVESFDLLHFDTFGSVKCFGVRAEMEEMQAKIREGLGLHVPLIRDPYRDDDFYVLQATHPQASKGHALRNFRSRIGCKGPVIAAGDDYNDLEMLEEADVRIAMAEAPEPLKKLADIVAGSARELGIIDALDQAGEIL